MRDKRLRNATVKVLFDLDSFYSEYGTYNKDEPDPSKTRYYLDGQRTDILRNEMFRLLGSPELDNDFAESYRQGSDYESMLDYIKDYLLDGDHPVDNRYYYMKLKESDVKPNHFFLDFVLKEGFFAYLKDNPSERIKIILQDILELLYENNVTDKSIVGHYMGLCFKGTQTFENNFIRFLGDK